MSIHKYEDLNSIHMDVLKEVGNIGSGNASTALSSMINQQVLIEMPTVKLLGFQEAIETVGEPDSIITGIMVRLHGDIEGMILFLIEQNFAQLVINTFFGEREVKLLELSEDEISALSEIGNIMASSYVSAIAQLANLTINVKAPDFTVDMLGAVMSVPAIEFGEMGEKMLSIQKTLIIDNIHIKANMMLIPTVDSLKILLNRLGVEA